MSDASATGELDRTLAHVADRLAGRYAGIVGRETVERCLFESYLGLRSTAKIASHLLPLAEHDAAARLAALADGHIRQRVQRVLFLCAYNSGRSQLAAALAHHHGQDRVIVESAGTHPAEHVDPTVLAVLDEIGVATPGARPKPLTEQMLADADVIVTMGCGDACPVLAGKRYLDWDIPDPAGADPDAVRAIRDDIQTRVHRLIDDVTTDGDLR